MASKVTGGQCYGGYLPCRFPDLKPTVQKATAAMSVSVVNMILDVLTQQHGGACDADV